MSCEGALLLVDASQGVEAQTVANMYLALEYDLEMLPVINKIDLPAADAARVKEEIEADLGLDPAEAVLLGQARDRNRRGCSRRSSREAATASGDAGSLHSALIFDAQYDAYRGVVVLVPGPGRKRTIRSRSMTQSA